MAYFPMFVDLTNQPCLVVGGGQVAYRKVMTLLDFDAKVIVVAKDICENISRMIEEKEYEIEVVRRTFEESDCDGKKLVIAATDDEQLNHDISQCCKAREIMVNAVDQKEDCSFIFPSYVKEQELVAAFSSSGNSPVLTQYLKAKEKDILTPFLGELCEYMGSIREDIIHNYATEAQRRAVFKDIVDTAIKTGKLPE